MSHSATPAVHPLSAKHYADSAVQTTAAVVENRQLARDTYCLRLECPEVGHRITPGQFLMLRLPGADDPLLGRPLALFDVWHDDGGVVAGLDVGYLVVGKVTRRLTQIRPGDALEIWGPLGNGFSTEPCERLLMVAGGIGQTPFLALGREALGSAAYGCMPRNNGYAMQTTLCYGVRTAELLAGVEQFQSAGIDVRIASDDGSVGRQGLVTDLVEEILSGQTAGMRIATCGPEPMMAAVAKLAARYGVPCEVSLETPMACGIGACFSCVTRVMQPDGEWDYKRTCVDGPVFPAEKIAW